MAFPYPYTGPIAPLNNLPIERQFYVPQQYFISDISNGVQTTITTSVNHDYVIGQQVRILIPSLFGETQLNGQVGLVVGIPASDQVLVNINSTGYNLFIPSPTLPTNNTTLPQIVAIGDVNSGSINSSGRTNNGTFIPGAFNNISPQ